MLILLNQENKKFQVIMYFTLIVSYVSWKKISRKQRFKEYLERSSLSSRKMITNTSFDSIQHAYFHKNSLILHCRENRRKIMDLGGSDDVRVESTPVQRVECYLRWRDIEIFFTIEPSNIHFWDAKEKKEILFVEEGTNYWEKEINYKPLIDDNKLYLINEENYLVYYDLEEVSGKNWLTNVKNKKKLEKRISFEKISCFDISEGSIYCMGLRSNSITNIDTGLSICIKKAFKENSGEVIDGVSCFSCISDSKIVVCARLSKQKTKRVGFLLVNSNLVTLSSYFQAGTSEISKIFPFFRFKYWHFLSVSPQDTVFAHVLFQNEIHLIGRIQDNLGKIYCICNKSKDEKVIISSHYSYLLTLIMIT